jgi:hypothetical protein
MPRPSRSQGNACCHLVHKFFFFKFAIKIYID